MKVCSRQLDTVRSLELERLAVLVGDGVGGRVERHAASEDERLISKVIKRIFGCKMRLLYRDDFGRGDEGVGGILRGVSKTKIGFEIRKNGSVRFHRCGQ